MNEKPMDLAPLDEMIEGEETPNPIGALEFMDPLTVREYSPPEGSVLVGENHIVKGSPFLIGGAPGVGKSRASVALAVAGATGMPWFGLPVHRQFKTLILQNENGRLRLKNEFSDLPCDEMTGFVKISPPPPMGLDFESQEFRETLRRFCNDWKPDVVLIDPWNATVRDDKANDYLTTFKLIRGVIGVGDLAPAIGIVAHTRKPKSDERANGRNLNHLVAGSYVLTSVPRAVFVLQAASDDPEDSQVVFTCAKNNDGQLGAPTAWIRRNGLFTPVTDFDWEAFRGGGKPSQSRKEITADQIASVFEHGKATMTKKRAVERLQELAGCGKSAAYEALKPTGPFQNHLNQDGDLMVWLP